MLGVLLRLPPEQLEHVLSAYAAAVAAKRRRIALGLLCLLAAVALAGIAGEVDLVKFARNIDRFPNYIRNLLPQLSWTNFGADVSEWFWNLDEWLKLLVDNPADRVSRDVAGSDVRIPRLLRGRRQSRAA